jgi:hypothetical protein
MPPYDPLRFAAPAKNCPELYQLAGWQGWKLQSEAENRPLVQHDSLNNS